MEPAKDSRTNLFIREEWPFPAPGQGILINHQIYIYMNIRNYCYYIYTHTRVFRVTYDLRTPSLARLGVSRPVNP